MGSKKSKRSPSAVDAAMAALMAGAAGFVVYAMPEAQFAAIVEASGLPQVVAAAQPPLGLTARVAAVAAAAAGTFLLVWLILRALAPKKKPAAKRVAQPVEIEIAPPKLRRADAHPDAPARRPIFAGLDLGEPGEPVQQAETAAAQAEPQPQPEPEPEPQPKLQPEPRGVRFVSERAPLEEATIPVLMQRLEEGLARREGKPSVGREAQAPEVEAPQIDERLRSAIHDLQQLARRG